MLAENFGNEEVKEFKLNDNLNDMLNELTARYLEDSASLVGAKGHIEDVEWQVVFDLKSELLKSLECLGIKLVN